MNMNTTNQTAKDVAQVVEIIAQRQYELGEMVGSCPHEVAALETLKVAAQGVLGTLKGTA